MVIKFSINRKSFTVRPEDFPADITLNTFIREHAKLFGTKFYCREGGCGVCIVTIKERHPISHQIRTWGANSCLVLLNICDGWDIVTIEGLGNKKTGYHPIQERLAHFNGTQCGYCSPGMIMNMYSNLEAAGGKMTMEEIENCFAGNICRCTGYRPILDAMKSFASDSQYEFVDQCADIEDLKLCPKSGDICSERCGQPDSVYFKDSSEWHHPRSINEVFDILNRVDNIPYMLVAGNTAHGVYRRSPFSKVFIDVNNVSELRTYIIGEVVELGANVSLTEMIEILQRASTRTGFEYFQRIVEHLNLVAHVSIRNMGTIAGNLSIKHQHNEFPSDIFLLLSTVGARIFIASSSTQIEEMSLPEFLKFDMKRKVIVKISFLKLNKDHIFFGSYKIMPRTQNSHAYVNAGFLFKAYEGNIHSTQLCFGGISPNFIESTDAASFLKGKNLFKDNTISEAIRLLDIELNTNDVLPDPSPAYRKKLALGLFYKFILKNAPESIVKPEHRTGGQMLTRPLSNGIQTFDTNKNHWPINQPVRKLEAMWQCSGEANYANDLPNMREEVWAAFVHATEVHDIVAKIDAQEALSIPGVIAFYSASDVPGKNSFVTPGLFAIVEDEEIFCSKVVKYHSQPVGVILAETFDLANYAAKRVNIIYERQNKQVVATLKDALKSRSPERSADTKEIESDIEHLVANRKLNGHFAMGSQFHFSMETQTTICIPREDGLLMYPSSHYLDLVQIGVANALKINENQIDIEIRRLGGSFGCKISRSNHVAVACAVASWLSRRPVRFVQSIESNMATNGKRNACMCDYSAVVNATGKLQSFELNFIEDFGNSNNDNPIDALALPSIPNCYDSLNWKLAGKGVLTDAPSHTWFRAPGSFEGIAMIENVMEHIARVTGMDPVDVRLSNLPRKSAMRELLPQFVKSTEYRQRRKEIEIFNKQNRWRKRGISITIMNFHVFYFQNIPATVTVYYYDGTVAISHGGIDCGQGINTKAAQVAAHTLDIPLAMVTIKASNSMNGANATLTGASVTSETVCFAVQKACKVLLDRMKPIREKLNNPKWSDITNQCFKENISLIANSIHKAGDMQTYSVYGLACSEIELDILTGNIQLNRVDILEDTGESLSPLIDVGQIEGAFVMGLSYWLTEKLIYDRRNGELMTNRTWNYKVFGAKDIPIDFRIKLLQSNPNSGGFMRSKTTGEIAICLSISALFALRHALDSARKDANITEPWYELGGPTTVEEVLLTAGHSKSQFQL